MTVLADELKTNPLGAGVETGTVLSGDRKILFTGDAQMSLWPGIEGVEYTDSTYLSLSGGRRLTSGAPNRVEVFPRDPDNPVGIQVIAEDGRITLHGLTFLQGPLQCGSINNGRIVARNAASSSDGAAGTLRDWERARIPVTFSGAASKDTTYTYATGFGQRPVISATPAEADAPLGNFCSQVYSAGATSCVVRLRDVGGVVRTGSTNADIIAML